LNNSLSLIVLLWGTQSDPHNVRATFDYAPVSLFQLLFGGRAKWRALCADDLQPRVAMHEALTQLEQDLRPPSQQIMLDIEFEPRVHDVLEKRRPTHLLERGAISPNSRDPTERFAIREGDRVCRTEHASVYRI
jgi:hypothetical protein